MKNKIFYIIWFIVLIIFLLIIYIIYNFLYKWKISENYFLNNKINIENNIKIILDNDIKYIWFNKVYDKENQISKIDWIIFDNNQYSNCWNWIIKISRNCSPDLYCNFLVYDINWFNEKLPIWTIRKLDNNFIIHENSEWFNTNDSFCKLDY